MSYYPDSQLIPKPLGSIWFTVIPLILHVVGARPNFPKAAPVMGALNKFNVGQLLVHTGQHYDDRLSATFFHDLQLPEPDVNLGVGSGSHAQQTAAVMTGIEKVLMERKPDLLVVYGDVNSTVAAALVGAKMHIPIAHVEAGLRSFDRSMPEEINRLITDQLSELLFTTSPEAEGNLLIEGIAGSKIHFVGNPMIDSLLVARSRVDSEQVLQRLSVSSPFIVATLHRPSNVDDPKTVRRLVAGLREVAQRVPILMAMHPRGRQQLLAAGLNSVENIQVVDALGYLDFLSLLTSALAVITDSGGVQEETTFLGVPCLTVRDTTERPITVSHGSNRLVTVETLTTQLEVALTERTASIPKAKEPPPLWDGQAGARIAHVINRWLTNQAMPPEVSSERAAARTARDVESDDFVV